MFLHRKRPEMTEHIERMLPVISTVKVNAIKPGPDLITRHSAHSTRPQPRDMRHDHEHNQQYSVIKREDAESPARIEIAKEVRRRLGIIENAGNQKSRKNEE